MGRGPEYIIFSEEDPRMANRQRGKMLNITNHLAHNQSGGFFQLLRCTCRLLCLPSLLPGLFFSQESDVLRPSSYLGLSSGVSPLDRPSLTPLRKAAHFTASASS